VLLRVGESHWPNQITASKVAGARCFMQLVLSRFSSFRSGADRHFALALARAESHATTPWYKDGWECHGIARIARESGHLGACADAILNGRISPHKNVTETREKEPRSDEKKTLGWLFLRQGALPTTSGADQRALLPLHGLSEPHRQRICYQCHHRNFGHKAHTRGAGNRPGSPCLWSTRHLSLPQMQGSGLE
jgi:hypothetical protein